MAYPTMNISTAATLPNISFYTEIRNLLNDPAPGRLVTNTQLLSYIKAAANIMTTEGKCQEVGNLVFSLATDTTEYTYNTIGFHSNGAGTVNYMVDIEAILYCAHATSTTPGTTAKALIKIDQSKLYSLDNNTAGPPVYWCDTGSSIRIWPSPTASENGHDCNILYYKNAQHLKNDDDTGTTYYVPNHWRELVIWYALAETYKKNGRPDAARFFRALFDKFVMFYRQDRLDKHANPIQEWGLADNTQFAQ